MMFLLFQGSREEILNTVVSIIFQNVPTCLSILVPWLYCIYLDVLP